MKKSKLITLALVLVMMLVLSMAVSAAAAGPFDTLEEAVGNKTWLQREYVIGGIPYWGGVGIGGEGPFNLANDDTTFKYGAGGNLLEESEGYWAVWKYDKAYVADSFIFATANDNSTQGGGRRMCDGWTISGGNGADGPWTVLYTGKCEDYEALDFTFFRIDLPSNATAFQFYKLYAEEGGDSDAIQLSVAGITAKDTAPVAAKPPAPFTVLARDFVLYAGWEGNTDGDARRSDLINDEEIEVAIETGKSEFGSNVGWTDKGEWLEYNINVPGAGKYVAKAWLASGADKNDGLELLFKGEVVGATGPVAKKDWQDYALYTIGEIDLVAGIQTVRVDLITGGFNISALEFVPVGMDNVDANAGKGDDSADAGATGSDGAGDAGGSAGAEAATKPAPPPAVKTGDTGFIVLAAIMLAGVVVFKRKITVK
jgi:hypothetical protein